MQRNKNSPVYFQTHENVAAVSALSPSALAGYAKAHRGNSPHERQAFEMDAISAGLPGWALMLAIGITFFAGFVKGTIGFAMPLIMISSFGSFMSPTTALAALIIPTIITNIQQAFRFGPSVVMGKVRQYWRLIAAIVVFIILSAQFVAVIPQAFLLGVLGASVVWFAGVQLSGRSLALRIEHRNRAEWGLGVIGGLYGGVSGVWGPPVLVFLLSIRADKRETVLVQGVVFLIGAVVLLGAHLQSGVLNAQTVPFSAALSVPAVAGMLLGFRLQDRLDPERFRWWTLVLLLLTGLNLLRRALLG